MFNEWCLKYEALIIFWGFSIEIILGLITATILIIEYFYDKAVEESKAPRRKRSKRVKIVIDADGNASIAEAPKNLDISVEHQGEK